MGTLAYPAFPLEHRLTTADALHEEKHLRLYMPSTPPCSPWWLTLSADQWKASPVLS